MTTYLDWNVIDSNYGPLLRTAIEGQTMSFNHVDCPAGTDRKKRLRITLKDNGNLVGYCHHCSQKGVFGPIGHSRIRKPAATRVAPDGRLTMPLNKASQITAMRVPSQRWLTAAGIFQSEVDLFGLYETDHGPSTRIVLPIFDSFGDVLAYQLRRVSQQDTGPKYITQKRAGVFHPMFLRTEPVHQTARLPLGQVCDPSQVLVIVEDILSAIRVGRHVPCLAVLGVNIPDRLLEVIAVSHFTHVIVALDNDNPEVRRQQRTALKRLELVSETYMLKLSQDFKNMDDAEIMKKIKICLTPF